MGGKGVSKRMERYALADSGRIGRLMEQAVELAGCHRLAGPLAWKQPALLHGSCGIETPPARLSPLPQQVERVGRQHDIAVLAALDCSTRMIFCALSMCLTFSLTTSPARRPQP